MKKVVFIGHIRMNTTPMDGETVKNQLLIKELGEYCKVLTLDFFQRDILNRLSLYIRAFFYFFIYRNSPFIFSTTASNFYPIIQICKFLRIKRNMIHWVIGGEFDKLVLEGKYNIDTLNYMSQNLVQSHKMVDSLKSIGVTNANYVSNFKKITFHPCIEDVLKLRQELYKKKFVFMSKILRTKGIEYVLDAVEVLNSLGYKDKFIVDFYGPSHPNYMEEFLRRVSMIENVEYKGVLQLNTDKGYEVLSGYDAFLFPTYHPSEGIAGVVLDAYVAGLPVIASDWGHNTEYIFDNKTGIIIPSHNVDALKDIMEKIMLNQIDLNRLSINSFNESKKYDVKNVITETFLQDIGVLN